MVEEFHKPEAVAPRIGLTLQAFYAACRAKQFPHVRIGKRIRVPDSLLQKWIAEQAVISTNAQESVNSY